MNKLLKNAIIPLALVSTLAPTSSVFASTSSTSVSNSTVVSQNQSNFSNLHVSVNKSHSNEVIFTMTNNGNTMIATVTNDGKKVTAKYVLNGKSAGTYSQDYLKAEAFGEMQQKGIVKPPADIPLVVQPNITLPQGDYMFDGKVYSPAGINRPYAHPDKGYYGISPYKTWSQYGDQDLHVQIDFYDSQAIVQGPAWAVGSGIGAAVGLLVTKNPIGGVVGAVAGGFLGGVAGAEINRLTDESGCVWFTIDSDPPLVNLSSSWWPEWYYNIRYIEIGPYSKTNYYYYVGGAGSSGLNAK